jgi:hypothetical protein
MALSGGSGADVETRVMGKMIDESGNPASNTLVRLIPSDYDPAVGPMLPDSLADTTDSDGNYLVTTFRQGTFNIEGVQLALGTKTLVRGISVTKSQDNVVVPQAPLKKCGTLRIILPDSSGSAAGDVYISGTTLFAHVGKGFAIIDSVPAGAVPPVRYIDMSDSTRNRLISASLMVVSGDTATIADSSLWKHSIHLYLNTTSTGAAVSGIVVNFPVLVRLSAGNFDFSQANADGSDLRFTKSNGTPLAYEIEKWDAPQGSAQGSAEVWVKLDTVYGNDSTHFLSMFWGNPKTASASNGAAVFDTANGFQGVWHLGEPQDGLAKDATLNHFDGSPSDTSPAAAAGMIDGARAFDGLSNYIQMKGTESGKLDFPQDGFYTVSAWVYARILDSVQQMIVSKDNQRQYHLQIKQNNWQFTVFVDSGGWESAQWPAVAGEWCFVAGVRNGSSSLLYINGARVDSVDTITSALQLPRNTSYDVTIGRISQNPDSSTFHFNGTIDEVRMSNVARGPDWVKLCYMNQKALDRLIVFRQ